jgi:hypothetical protein
MSTTLLRDVSDMGKDKATVHRSRRRRFRHNHRLHRSPVSLAVSRRRKVRYCAYRPCVCSGVE